jgi:hypothetical protein
MNTTRIILISFLTLLIIIQFIRPEENKSNDAMAADLFNLYSAPATVETMVKNSCYDCHSNNTRYPWYSNIQPFGWWLAHHVKEGKSEINFNEFGMLSPRRQISKLKNVEGSIKDGSMPLSSYTLAHTDARLSGDDKNILIDWFAKLRDSIQNTNRNAVKKD